MSRRLARLARRAAFALRYSGCAAPQTCKDCWRADGLDFLVSNRIWNLVMAGVPYEGEGVGGVVCLSCFDARARAAGVPYHDHLVVLGAQAWQAGSYEGGVPK